MTGHAEGPLSVILPLALLLAGLVAAGQLACSLGLSAAPRTGDPERGQLGALQAALLGLLGLLLGFTFSMTASRYDTRRLLVVDEANAIGTAYLRAGALEEPARAEVRHLLEAYVGARLDFYQAGDDAPRLAAASQLSERLQVRFWSRAMAAARTAPTAITLGLLLQALNDVIDLHSKRLMALENRVPDSILVLLVLLAMGALAMVGYSSGLAGSRELAAQLLLAVLVAAVVFVIVDLDRPYRGLIQVGQGSMIALRESLKRYR